MAKAKKTDEPVVKSWREVLKEEGLSTSGLDQPLEVLPTKFEGLKRILEMDGLPAGRIIEIYGDRGQGKTNFALDALKSFQDTYGTEQYYALIIDSEGAHDAEFMKLHGIDPEAVVRIYEPILEKAYGHIVKHAKTGRCKFLIVDSVGQLQPGDRSALFNSNADKFDFNKEGEREKPMRPGQFAVATQDAMKDAAALIRLNNIYALFINQIRTKIGGYGDPTTTPGGKLFEFSTHIRIQLTGGKTLWQANKVNGIKIGHAANAKVVRNRVNGKIGQTTDKEELQFYFEGGPKRYQLNQAYDKLARASVLQMSGNTWIKLYNTDTGEVQKQWQGRGKLDEELLNDDELFNWFIGLAETVES